MMPIVLEISVEQLGRIIAVKTPSLLVSLTNDLKLLLFKIDLVEIKRQQF